MYKFIELTFYRSPKTHGTAAGTTSRKFWQRADLIARIVPYEDSTKLIFIDCKELEVVENINQIISKLTPADKTKKKK
jgi:hypothetical protein